MTYPRARYLSQQFVEELCSSSGMTDALLREIERVIFESHPLTERRYPGFRRAAGAARVSVSASYADVRKILLLSCPIALVLSGRRTANSLNSLRRFSQKHRQIERYTADRAETCRLRKRGADVEADTTYCSGR